MPEELDHIPSEQLTSASEQQAVYEKPVVELFLQNATEIQSGVDDILESQGSGYLDS